MNEREQLAKDNGMTIEFVNWFFDNKKDGCGNVWFMMMAAMWEGWKVQEAKCAALAAEVQAVRWACGQVYMKGYNHGHLNTVDGLDYASETELVERGGEALADFTDPDHCGVAADAILAEVRAQGVDMFASKCKEESKCAHSSDCRDSWWVSGENADEFAAQLRQGGAA
ncbi:hypothetical protein G7090_16460 [Leclercia sp. 29361]|uniref:hypothetical protein n=1 Tax=Leclercia sp. 29361 TaxID=2714951 RepID=UPI00140D26AC|nr:hypothetical protein [Leclercia sp. 29361]QIK11846.1 hypothetical protein G7090_16460 [Leclercia sp. 29361]